MKKLAVIAFASIITQNAFACKPSSEIASSQLFINGVINKISSLEEKKNSKIISIRHADVPNTYNVQLQDTNTGQCSYLMMNSYGTGSCDFTADIIDERIISCAN